MIEIVLALLLVFAVNAMPALMPPTWAILAFLHLSLDIPLLPLAVGGALAASAGRLILALVSRRYGMRALAPAQRTELAALGSWLDLKARWAAPLAVLVYSFGPIPSNQLFIAAGLTRMPLTRIFAAFLAGRLVSYPVWIGVAHVAASRIEELFTARLGNLVALATEGLLIAILVAFTRVDWIHLIARIDPAFARALGGSPTPERADRTLGAATFGPAPSAPSERASRP